MYTSVTYTGTHLDSRVERDTENESVLPGQGYNTMSSTRTPPKLLNMPLQCCLHVRKMQTVMLHAHANNQNSVSVLVLL